MTEVTNLSPASCVKNRIRHTIDQVVGPFPDFANSWSFDALSCLFILLELPLYDLFIADTEVSLNK